ncbi:dTMP kinase [Candidatus Babeliales bacterium]|nr:dTMP kinase [Candidatus Babeliales bacterium]
MNSIENRKKPAPLISCEGIDGSGKSTLVRLLLDYLTKKNLSVFLTKEPGGTRLGKNIRQILQHHDEPINPMSEFLLFAADRADHIKTVVQPLIQKGTWVISDRMHDSSVAYQGYGRGISVEHIHHVNQWALQGVEQDITIYLKIDPQTAHERINARNETKTRFEQETEEFWHSVIDGFESIFSKRNNVITVDAKKSSADIFIDVINHPLFINLLESDAVQ